MPTKIEWCKRPNTIPETWSPVTGCTPISEGCKNCYAERMSKRLAGRFGYPQDEPFRVTMHPDRLDIPLKWRKPRTVFVCSMGDLFHEDVSDGFISSVFYTITQAKDHTFVILTKRAKRMYEWFNRPASLARKWYKPKSNVIGMVTVENQEQADKRIPWLLKCPFATYGVSIEPMLGPVDLSYWQDYDPEAGARPGLNWVICGGETGPRAREMNPDWARDIRDQCKASGTPFFMKQMSNRASTPDDLLIREWPKTRS